MVKYRSAQDKLFDAIFIKDIQSVKFCVENRAEINVKGSKVKTFPLHSAVCSGNLAIIKTLLQNGANMNFYFLMHLSTSFSIFLVYLIIRKRTIINMSWRKVEEFNIHQKKFDTTIDKEDLKKYRQNFVKILRECFIVSVDFFRRHPNYNGNTFILMES